MYFSLTPLAVATAMGTICSITAEGEQFRDEDPTKTGARAFKVETYDAPFKDGGATRTGAMPWITWWWYLLQPSTSHRFLREQSSDCWSADSKQEKHNLFSLPN